MAKEKNLESSMEALDCVLEALEKEEVSLEDSFKLYQKGMKLIKECNDAIDKVEKKIIVIKEEVSEE